ncbi:F-box/LRR-repeat protein At3g26922-like [Argentina anserina]|uniref:F-box/LRR-repeat protein At3g26922-like n=1 Tax=Argentina anserina TaxID=57926 RepID=UPI0021765413|nr:F-box/LRR-repeat protein At3g26922-like [Potentilla anserina]
MQDQFLSGFPNLSSSPKIIFFIIRFFWVLRCIILAFTSSQIVQYKKHKLGGGEMKRGSKSLSDLPVEVILKIFSLLPTKDAIRTTILSKSWESMWTLVPNLTFIEWKFEKRDLFMNAVERALMLRGPADIKEFTLSCEVVGDAIRVNTWIYAVVQRNVEVLSLVLPSFIGPISLPRSLFTSTKLKVLQLNLRCIFRVPSTICFTSLRRLALSSVVFSDDKSAQKLFSGCPVLEDIFLYSCNWANINLVTISVPKLLRFTINEGNLTYVKGSNGCCIKVVGVTLAYFSYMGKFLDEYLFDDSSAHEVEIFPRPTKRVRQPSTRLCNLLDGLSSMKHLTISHTSFEMIQSKTSELLDHMRSFNNLTALILGHVVDLGCKGLLTFLQKCPSLKYLAFCEGIVLHSDDAKDDGMLEPLPPCFLSSLEVIDVLKFCGLGDERRAIKVLLKCAMVLKKVNINWRSVQLMQQEPMEDISTRLLNFPKGSENCEVVLFVP